MSAQTTCSTDAGSRVWSSTTMAGPSACHWSGAPVTAPVCNLSVAVVVRFVGAVDRYADVVGLLGLELGQLRPERVEVQPRDLFVEVLRQHVDADRVVIGLREQL